MSKTRPDLSMFTAAKGSASAAPLTAPRPVPTPANVDQQPAAEAAPIPAPVIESQPEETRASKPRETKRAAKPGPVEDEEMVPVSFRVSAEYRHELKRYALDQRKAVIDVFKEAIELHRQKHGRK